MSDIRPRHWSELKSREGQCVHWVSSELVYKHSDRDGSSTCAELTRVSVIQDHLAVEGLHPRLANRLQAKLNPAARLQVRQDEHRVVLFVPVGHFLCDVVCPIEVEGSEEGEGEVAVVRGGPGQSDAAAVP